MTDDECKRVLFRVGLKFGVSPRLISTELMSADDKQDMRDDKFSQESLEKHVEVWKYWGCEKKC